MRSKALPQLKKEAQRTTNQLGHSMQWESMYDGAHRLKISIDGQCRHCKKKAVIDTAIAGDAVKLRCDLVAVIAP